MISIGSVLFLLALIQFKHLVVDWMWQPAYEFMNKGTYGHWGGIRHSLKNAIGTMLCFIPFIGFSFGALLFVFCLDFLIHYHTDYLKMNINRIMKWDPAKNCEFWWLTGLDQFIHQFTYLLLVFMVFVN